MRRLLLAIVLVIIAVFVTGGTLPRAASTAPAQAKVELRHQAKTKTIAKVKSAHLEKRADALYEDDDTDDDDDDVAGLMPPQTDDDDGDASPQQPALAVQDHITLASDAPSFTPGDDTLGPASGHRRPEEPPPRG